MLTRRRRHAREGGQALLMALGFIAFFGLATLAVLRLVGTDFLAESNAQAAAGQKALAQGAALFAAADARQRSMLVPGGQVSEGSCLSGATAGMSMPNGVKVGYTTEGCNPGSTADLLADQCTVCILGSATIDGSLVARDGPLAFNADPTGGGSAASSFAVAGGPNPGFIGCPDASGCSRGDFALQPAPRATTGSFVATPPAPPPVPAGSCPDVNGSRFEPGTYSSGCPDSTVADHRYTMESGVYIFQEMFLLDNDVTVSADGPVLLYFADGGQLYLQSGSLLDLTGGAGLLRGGALLRDGSVTAADVSIYFDPSDQCRTVGDEPPICLSISQNATLDAEGTVYIPAGASSVSGTMSITPLPTSLPSGSLVVGDLSIDASGFVNVDSAPPSGGYCFVYDDSAWAQDSSSTVKAHVVVASNCNGGSGIVDLDYGP